MRRGLKGQVMLAEATGDDSAIFFILIWHPFHTNESNHSASSGVSDLRCINVADRCIRSNENVNVADDHPRLVDRLMNEWRRGDTGLYNK